LLCAEQRIEKVKACAALALADARVEFKDIDPSQIFQRLDAIRHEQALRNRTNSAQLWHADPETSLINR
jgi:hypothetical protein